MGQYEVLKILNEHKGKKLNTIMIKELYNKKYTPVNIASIRLSLKKLSNFGLIKKDGNNNSRYFWYWMKEDGTI